jgi:hypothetical protein
MGIAETIAREENDKLRSKIAALVSEVESLRAERDDYKKALNLAREWVFRATESCNPDEPKKGIKGDCPAQGDLEIIDQALSKHSR